MGTDLERELADIRREVIEGRNLVIRNDNLLKTLHSEVKAFGARQKDFERRQKPVDNFVISHERGPHQCSPSTDAPDLDASAELEEDRHNAQKPPSTRNRN